MTEYLYDTTFEGLLTAVWHALSAGTVPFDIRRCDRSQPSLLATSRLVTASHDHASRLCQAVRKRLGGRALQTVAAAFLSERDGIEYAIAVWLADRFESRVPIPESERDQARYTVEDAARAYGRELHGLKGLLRFRELRDGVLYAPVAPVANVVQGLAAHFRQRLPRDAWVIHDTGRDLALHWDGERLAQADLDPALCRAVRTHGEPPSEYLAAHETRVQTEWRSFFNRIAIPERRNPRLQQQLMPARYWRYLVETPGTPREDP